MLRPLIVTLVLISGCAAKCISVEQAYDKIGSESCVTGKVLNVQQLPQGHFTLNFCATAKNCAFSVVVFRDDLRDVGDVRHLEGKNIEIHGRIKEYRGHAEIILKDNRQLRGEAARIPPLPKTYDVSRRGNYSAGSFYGTKSSKRTNSRRAKKPSDPIEPIEPAMQE